MKWNPHRVAPIPSTISWEACLEILRKIVPDPKNLAFDEIHRAALCAGLAPEWKVFPNWEALEDLEILKTALDGIRWIGKERVILLPDLCYWQKLEPFVIAQEEIEDFVGRFLVQHGEAFFNGDTMILLPSIRIVFLFDHNGRYCTLRGKTI